KMAAHVLMVRNTSADNAFPANWLKAGNTAITTMTATNAATKLNSTASVINWRISCFLKEPKTLRIPISFALLADCAVERFMKFTQAKRIMNKAIAENM